MNFRYTLPASTDLEAILDYIGFYSPQGAMRVKKCLQETVSLLLLSPYMGVRTDEPGTRRIAIYPYPYFVFYEIADDELIIHAIRHMARDPSSMP